MFHPARPSLGWGCSWPRQSCSGPDAMSARGRDAIVLGVPMQSCSGPWLHPETDASIALQCAPFSWRCNCCSGNVLAGRRNHCLAMCSPAGHVAIDLAVVRRPRRLLRHRRLGGVRDIPCQFIEKQQLQNILTLLRQTSKLVMLHRTST